MLNIILGKLMSLVPQRLIRHLWQVYVTINLSRIKNKDINNLFEQSSKLDIESDTSRGDCKALSIIVQKVLRDRVKVVEIGSWKGMTTSVIANTIKEFDGTVYAIDHWQGCEGAPHHETITKQQDVFSVFKDNMEALELDNHILPIVVNSLSASLMFQDKSLDLVFIDADHRYDFVKFDIEAWLPKIKVGGILCGHDCQLKYTESGSYKKEIDNNINKIVIPGVCHPGVTKALYDTLQDNYSIVPNSSIWWYRKA